MRIETNIVGTIRSSVWVLGVGSVAGALMVFAVSASAQSILVGNFLPNPDMETETRFVPHRTEGPTDNSFADYWHHSLYSGWNDLTPPVPPMLPGPADTVLSGIHSLRLYDQTSYYFAPGNPGAGEFTQEEFRTFATAIPLDLATPDPTDLVKKLWFRWHWNYDLTAGTDLTVTFNIRLSEAPVIGLDLVAPIDEFKTFGFESSFNLWEEVTYEIDLTDPFYVNAKSFDMIVLTEGSDDAIGVMYVDDVSVSAIDPAAVPALDADFDNDGDRDGKDFLTWQRGFGTGTNNMTGDANGDSIVNGADLAVWQDQFGTPPLAAATAVPEPSTGTMLLLGIGAAWGMCRTRCGDGR